MNISLTNYHGRPVGMAADSLLKLRPALANLRDPKGCTLVDAGKSGHFVLGSIQEIADLLSPYVRLAILHAPDGMQIYLNADAMEKLSVNPEFAGNSVSGGAAKWQYIGLLSRNKIPLLETAEVARIALDSAARAFAVQVETVSLG